MDWLHSRISQWIMPFTSHWHKQWDFFWCRLHFAWSCAVALLSVHVLLHNKFKYRHYFSSVITTLFSQSKLCFLVVSYRCWCSKVEQFAGFTNFFQVMQNDWCQTSQSGYRPTNAHCQCVRVDHILVHLRGGVSHIGTSWTNC